VSNSRLWLRIAAPVLLLLLLVGAVAVRVFLDRLPDHAAQTIAERYRDQIEALTRLAEADPVDPCDAIDPVRMLDGQATIRAWEERMDAYRDRFDDPVILGAEVVGVCGHTSISRPLKAYEPGGPVWTPSMFDPSEDWPWVSVWYAGLRRVVQYEDRVSRTPRGEARLRLLLDYEGLALHEVDR